MSNAQNEVIPDIIDVVDETVYKARQESFTTKKETIVTTDGYWDNGRNGSNCTVSAIGYKVCNYSGSSNMMESFGLHEITKDLKTDPNCKITKFVHDGDNKSDGVLLKEGIDCENGFDIGHGILSLERRLTLIKKIDER